MFTRTLRLDSFGKDPHSSDLLLNDPCLGILEPDPPPYPPPGGSSGGPPGPFLGSWSKRPKMTPTPGGGGIFSKTVPFFDQKVGSTASKWGGGLSKFRSILRRVRNPQKSGFWGSRGYPRGNPPDPPQTPLPEGGLGGSSPSVLD